MVVGASASSVKAGGAYVEVGGNTAKLDAVLATARGKLAAFGAGAVTLGRKFMMAGAVMAAPLVGGIKLAKDFSGQMAQVGTMLAGGDYEKFITVFGKGIRDLSVEFGEGTATLANGLYDILSASIAPAKALDVLRASVQAARAGFTDTGTAADAITTILNSYKLSASRAADVSDLLFATVKRGKTTFGQLAPAIGMVAATASVSGLSMEELAASIATATRNGVRTRIAVTALNSVLMAFIKPTTKAEEASKKFGFELDANTLRTIGLKGVIEKLQGATEKQITSVFENRRALKLIMPVMQDLEGYTTDLTLAQKRQGLTLEALSRWTDTLSFKWDRLKQITIDTFRAIGLALEGGFKAGMDAVIRNVLRFRAWIMINEEVIRSFARLTKNILLIGLSLLIVGKIFAALAFLMSTAGSIGLIVAGLVLMADSIGLIDLGFRDFIGNIRIGVLRIKDYWTLLGIDMLRSWERVKMGLKNSWAYIVAGFTLAGQYIAKALLASFQVAFDKLAELIDYYADYMPDTLAEKMWKAADAFRGMAKTAGDAMALNEGAIGQTVDELHSKLLKNYMEEGKAIQDLEKMRKDFLEEEAAPAYADYVNKQRNANKQMQQEYEDWLDKILGTGAIGVPGKAATGIVGTFAGASAALVAGGPRTIEADQLSEQKRANDLLSDIKGNTENMGLQ